MENKIDNPVLVTGASGFIGANLVRRLVAEGFEVHLILRKQSKTWRLDDILDKVYIHRADLTDYQRVEAVVKKIKPKTIFHLAAYGAYPFQKEPDKIKAVNLDGTINLLTACEKVGYKIFINTGSSSEYGFKKEAMRETDSLEPNSHYAVFKAAATNYCQYEAKSKDLPIITLRPFSVYGPYEEPTRLVPTLLSKLFKDQCPPLVAPETARDYIYVDDVVDLYLAVAARPDLAGEVFNMGSGVQTTLKQMVDTAVELTGAKVEPKWGTMKQRIWDQNIWQADITKTKEKLNWQPRYDLRQGLEKTSVWLKNNLKFYQNTEMIKVDCPICGQGAPKNLVYSQNLADIGSANFSARKTPDNLHYQMVRCDFCGLLYASSIYDPETIDGLYQESDFNYDDEVDNLKKTYGRYLELAEKLAPGKGRLLEIGCGNGFLLEQALDQGWEEVAGVEPSDDAIARANSRVKNKIVHGVFNSQNYPEDHFDVVFFAMVIEHMADVNSFLQGIYKVLKPGGIVMGITHNEQSFLAKVLKDKCPIINDEHVYVFNKKTIKKVFSKNDFIIEEVGAVANKYSLRYWLKMLPLPNLIKNNLPYFLTKFSLTIRAGNIYILGKKPGGVAKVKAEDQIEKLEGVANDLRRMIVDLSHKKKAHHIGSSLSCIDILTALYFNTMNIDPKDPQDPDRDWFVLSKGHAAQAQYVALAKKGFFPEVMLEKEFLAEGGKLGGHPDKGCVPGVEMSSGSLGHGLSVGIGVAIAARRDKSPRQIYVLLGDGECNEGMIWEAAMFASHHKLDSLIAIIDYNRLQAFGTTDETLNLDPIGDKFKAFGWAIKEVDGHNMGEIVEALDSLPFEKGRPNLIVAHTVKGKGAKFIENKLESHYVEIDDQQREEIIKDLGF